MMYSKNIFLDKFTKSDAASVLQLPGGEFHPTIICDNDCKQVIIYTRIKDGNDLLKLFTVTSSIRQQGIRYIDAVIPYFPGARQDRVSGRGEAFTLHMYAELINAQKYSAVYIIDPHSDVCPALINNCKIIPVESILRTVLANYDTILMPDAGAAKKLYSYYLKNIDWEGSIIQCLKERDTKSGKLSGFKVLIDETWTGRLGNCIILDDICDGGGTFLGLAKELERYQTFGLDKIGLYITHGIFSKGFDELFKTFDDIWTTNSWSNEDGYKSLFKVEGSGDFPIPIEYKKEWDNFHVMNL